MKETNETLKRIGKMIGGIAQNQGDIAEEFFFNSLIRDNHLGQIHFDDISQNQSKHRGKLQEEYDLVLTNGNAIGIVEVKYKCHENDLDKLERKLNNFKLLYPIYKDYTLYGAMAAFHINKKAKEAALNRGYFVLQRSGEIVHTVSRELVTY
jgi:predicted AAA+ superfamily ATPase